MSTLAMPSAPAVQMNWPRIGALSGSLSLHLYVAVLLLMPPLAIEVLNHTEPEKIVGRFISIPMQTQAKAEPALPVPTHHPRHHPASTSGATTPRTTAVGPIAATTSVDPDPGIPVSTPDLAVEVAPTALAYGTRTLVPYPREALRRREHGTVILRVLVGPDGLPQSIEIETSSGSPRLDSAAREAVMHWSFRPGTRDGAARSAWARVPIAFDLSSL